MAPPRWASRHDSSYAAAACRYASRRLAVRRGAICRRRLHRAVAMMMVEAAALYQQAAPMQTPRLDHQCAAVPCRAPASSRCSRRGVAHRAATSAQMEERSAALLRESQAVAVR